MAEIAPDAVLVMTLWLRGRLATAPYSSRPEVAGVKVSGELPPARTSSRHIRLRRSGGVRANVAQDAPRLDVQIWHEDDRLRAELAELVRALWLSAPNTVVPAGAVNPRATTIGRVTEFAGPNLLPDPVTGSTREIIQWTVETRLRVAAL